MKLNGEHIRTIDRIHAGDTLSVTMEDTPPDYLESEIRVPVLYEDEDVMVYNKPVDMPCHQAKTHQQDTLANVFARDCRERGLTLSYRCINRLDRNTSGAVVLGMVYNYLPYMILPLYGVIVKIDSRLIEAAEDLGCNSTQVFSRVVLPLSVPGILSGMTMVFVPAVSTFYISQKLGGTDTVLIGDVIERQFKQGNNPNLGAALSLVLMILVFICTGIMNRFGGDNEEGGVIV